MSESESLSGYKNHLIVSIEHEKTSELLMSPF